MISRTFFENFALFILPLNNLVYMNDLMGSNEKFHGRFERKPVRYLPGGMVKAFHPRFCGCLLVFGCGSSLTSSLLLTLKLIDDLMILTSLFIMTISSDYSELFGNPNPILTLWPTFDNFDGQDLTRFWSSWLTSQVDPWSGEIKNEDFFNFRELKFCLHIISSVNSSFRAGI